MVIPAKETGIPGLRFELERANVVRRTERAFPRCYG
jgi:hypothetical protein